MLHRNCVALVVFVGLVGCGSKPSVTGTATFNGTAIEQGSVTLIPASTGKTLSAPIANGSYSLRDASIGKYTAVITGTHKLNHTARPTGPTASQPIAGPVDYIPAEADGNSREVSVAAGVQTHDFAITGPKAPQ